LYIVLLWAYIDLRRMMYFCIFTGSYFCIFSRIYVGILLLLFYYTVYCLNLTFVLQDINKRIHLFIHSFILFEHSSGSGSSGDGKNNFADAI